MLNIKINRKIILCFVATFVLLLQFDTSSLFAQSSQNVTVKFDYNKAAISGSNQFAIWVAAKDGSFIKTLYVTRFAGSGGYNKRPDALPLWAKNHSKTGLDAVTEATPDTSIITAVWNFTDADGNSLPTDAEYSIFIEATVHIKNNVLYSASINSKSIGEVKFSTKYSTSEAKKSNMIDNVLIYCNR